jgi:hypothetical protein
LPGVWKMLDAKSRSVRICHLLPVLQVLVLAWAASVTQIQHQQYIEQLRGGGFVFPPQSSYVDFVLLMNLPIMVLTLPFSYLSNKFLGDGTEWVSIILALILAVPFWYAIGLWFDHRFGLSKEPVSSVPKRLARALTWVVFFLVALSFLLTVFLGFAAEGIRRQQTRTMSCWLLAWTSFGLLVLGRMIYRWHHTRKA